MFAKHDRVELAPHLDRWMMGDRYGTVINVISGEREGEQVVGIRVNLDKSCLNFTFSPDDLKKVSR